MSVMQIWVQCWFLNWGMLMKIASWNVNSLNVRLPHVLQWLENHPVDVLALQELKLDQDKFPISAIEEAGYHAVWFGQKTYNGVALLFKGEATDVVTGIPNYTDEQRRMIAATINGVRIINVYCVNGEAVDSAKFAYKREWFAALNAFVAQEMQQHEQVVLLGDFNIAPADLDVYDAEKWQGKILCSTDERQWFQQLLALGLHDSFRSKRPEDVQYTWWDYRMNMFKRKLGLRIDHILVSTALKETIVTVDVDEIARSWERPSDHAPITLEVA